MRMTKPAQPGVRYVCACGVLGLLQFLWCLPGQAAVLNYVSPNPTHPSLKLWLDVDTLPTSSTSISLWEDSSSTGSDATQGTAASQPMYVTSNPAFSSWPTVHFDGANDVLTTSALTSTLGIDGGNDRTVFVVFKQDTGANKNVLGFGANSTQQLFDVLLHSSKVVGHFHGGGNDTIGVTSQTYSTGALTIGTLRFDSGTIDVFQHDGSVNTLIATKAQTLNTGVSAINVGSGIFGTYNFFNGDIAEVLIYNEALSESDRMAIDNYLFTKYSMTPAQWAEFSTVPVPEPGTGLLLGMAVCVASQIRRRAR